MDAPQGFFRRSGSIWRRLSRRESGRKPSSQEAPTTHHKLHKRATEPIQISKPIITHTHLQRIEAPARSPASTRTTSTTSTHRSANRVRPTDMQITPFPNSSRVQTVSWNVFLTPEQIYHLIMGFKPLMMEDKWFIYSEGPDRSGKLKVHFHRSWTGLKIAELFVLIDVKGEGAGKIVGIKWNGTGQTNGLEEEEAKYMISTTCSWILGVDLETGLS